MAGSRLMIHVQLLRQRWLDAHLVQDLAQLEHLARDLARDEKLILHHG